MSRASFNKILVVNPFGIGDAIFSMYLVEALKQCLPQAQIGFLGNERTIGLLRMNRSVDICHEFNRDEFRRLRGQNPAAFISKIFRFGGEIKKERYDAMFDLSLGREFAFMAGCVGIGKRIGFDFKRRGRWLTRKTKFEGYEKKHVVEWQLDLLRSLSLAVPALPARLPLLIPEKAIREAGEFLAAQGITPGTLLIAAAPGGGKSWGSNAVYKQWNPAGFTDAIQKSRKKETVLLLGDKEEEFLLDEVKGGLSLPCAKATGLPLDVVCALLRQSRLLLCNDGGLLHLANALGVPTVSVYGPVDEKVYGPYGSGVPREVLTQDVPCRPCYSKFHFPPCGNERRCLEELPAEKVLAGIGKIS